MAYNLAAIRQLVSAAFSDDELTTFCFDHFPSVGQNFTAGQTLDQRVLLLVDFAARQGQLGVLLDAIKQANPYQYERFGTDVRADQARGDLTQGGEETRAGISRPVDEGLPGPSQQKPRPVGTEITVTQQVNDNSGEATGVAVGTIQGPVSFQGPVTLKLTDLPSELATRLRLAGEPAAEDLRQQDIKFAWFEPETILIPAGPFLMGTDDPVAPAPERPQHTVDLPAFRIGKYPVTNAQYAEFVAQQARPLDFVPPLKAGWINLKPPEGRSDHPVTWVSWGRRSPTASG